MKFTYTIFDGDPNASDGNPWPDHDDVEIEGDDLDDVIDEVMSIMEIEAARCNEYKSGDRLWALIWDEDGRVVGWPTVTLTEDYE